MPLSKDEIAEFILSAFRGVEQRSTWGETAFFYNPGQELAHGVYFITLKHADSENDSASQLGRDRGFRMNIGLPKSEYYRLFGPTPGRPGKGGVVATGHDFTRRNVLMPHPVYGWMAWTAIVDPEQDSFDKMRPLLTASYQHAVARFEKRLRENRRKAARL